MLFRKKPENKPEAAANLDAARATAEAMATEAMERQLATRLLYTGRLFDAPSLDVVNVLAVRGYGEN